MVTFSQQFFKHISSTKIIEFRLKISLNFVPKGPDDNVTIGPGNGLVPNRG